MQAKPLDIISSTHANILMFLFQKQIDRSALRQGFQIPVEYHHLLEAMPGGMLRHGETREIKIIIENKEYDAQLKNQGFDRNKYEGHSDVVQIRYNEGSEIAKKLRLIFHSTWEYVNEIKNTPENINRKFIIRIPEERQEYLVLNSTNLPNVFVADCVTTEQKQDMLSEVKKMDELDFETFEPVHDSTAGYRSSTAIRRIRKLDKNIGDSLKRLYDYRCQMTGDRIGDAYNALVVEAHHIIPFTESMNNDTSNIIILSPTYHRIIHKAKPVWDQNLLAFCYENGLVERVKINKHL